jgi:glycosyltransferase involved in cell wall biosynthesis
MFEGMIFKLLDQVYTVSEQTLRHYRGHYSGQIDKFAFLPTWVDPNVFHASGERKEEIRSNIIRSSGMSLPVAARWILFVGRLQEQKAPLRLIETFSEYHKKDRDSVLILVGDGNLKPDVQKHAVKLSLQNRVFFVSNMTQRELVNYYQASDLLLLTSNFEGMPRCVLEALGSGLPVVTTDVGEVRKVVQSGFSGEISESFSPVVLSDLIAKVFTNPKNYSVENCLKSVLDYSPAEVLGPVYQKIRTLFHEYSRRQLR